MSTRPNPTNFPSDLVDKILWSPNVDGGAGRLSRASYVLITPESPSGTSSPSMKEISLNGNKKSVVEIKVSEAPSAEPGSLVVDAAAGCDAKPVVTTDIEGVSSSSDISASSSSKDINVEIMAPDNNAPSNSVAPWTASDAQDNVVMPSLPDKVLEEIKARFSYKFSAAAQMESVKAHKVFHDEKEPIVEPIVHLYYPQGGCHEIIDEAIKAIAKAEDAEVLTLDALALASTESSIFGDEFRDALTALYKDPIRHEEEAEDEDDSDSETGSDSSSDGEEVRKRRRERRKRHRAAEKRKWQAQEEKEKKLKEERKEKDEELQAIFDALLSLSAHQDPHGTVIEAKKRIVYLRDFGSIAKVSSPLIVRLLRAIHSRRTARFCNGVESEDLIQPTLLVLGYSNFVGTSGISESVFVRGGEALRKALPSIGEVSLLEDLSSVTLSPIASRFFLGSLAVESKEQDSDDDSDDDYFPYFLRGMGRRARRQTSHPASLRTSNCFTFDGPTFCLENFDLASKSLAMSIFLKGPEKKGFSELEKRLCSRRKADIANAWLRMSLTQRRRRTTCGDIITLLGNDVDLQKDLVEDEKEKERKNKSKSKRMHKGKKGSKTDLKKSEEPRGPYIGEELLTRLAELTNSSIPVTLDQGITTVLGLTNAEQSSDDVPEVSLHAFSKAFQMLIQNHKSRDEWWKENAKSPDKDEEKDEDPVVESIKKADDLTSHERKLLSCIVDPNELTTSFDDVCIAEKTVESLRTIISLPLRFPDAFKSGVLGRESMGGVLLYGPPGTGKTMVCRAVARECGARMLVIKPSDIMDCYVGESEKIVKAVFTLAYRLAPCLIFIDELDAVFGKRKEDDKKWVRDILAEFLQSMDGLKSAKTNKDAGVVLIGATNRPQDIDEAVIRRLPSRMLVDAPEEKQRKRILELHLRGEELDADVKLDEVAAKTKNYSGSDLKNLCVAAAMASVKEAIGTLTWEPLKPNDVPKAGEDATDDLNDKDDEANEAKAKINKRTLKMKHFTAGLAEVSGSLSGTLTGQSDLQRWHSQYGAGASSRPSYGAPAAGSRTGGSSYGAGGNYGAKAGAGTGSYGAGGNATAGSGGYGTGANRYGAGAGSSYGAPSGNSAAGAGGGTSGAANFNSAAGNSAPNGKTETPGASAPRATYSLNGGSGLGPNTGSGYTGAAGAGYARYGSANSNENVHNLGANVGGNATAASGVPRYGTSTFGKYGAGGNLGGGLGNVGSSGFSASSFTTGSGGGHNVQEGPHASIEQVDEENQPGA